MDRHTIRVEIESTIIKRMIFSGHSADMETLARQLDEQSFNITVGSNMSLDNIEDVVKDNHPYKAKVYLETGDGDILIKSIENE